MVEKSRKVGRFLTTDRKVGRSIFGDRPQTLFFEMEKPERKNEHGNFNLDFLMVAQAEVKMFISFNFCRISITRGENSLLLYLIYLFQVSRNMNCIFQVW